MKTLGRAALAMLVVMMMLPALVAFGGNQFISVQEEPVWSEEYNRWCVKRTSWIYGEEDVQIVEEVICH